MPYTLSHAIISAPISALTDNRVPLAALVIGSMSPDFPYLLALTPTGSPGHSLSGVVTHCLLPSLLLLAIWHRFLEKPTVELFGLRYQAPSMTWQACFFMVLGVLIGGYSHVLWDATSHSYGYFVENSSFLNRELFSLPLYKWNQYGSGVLGLLCLFIWYLVALTRVRAPDYRGRIKAGVGIYLLCIVLFVVLANLIHGSSTLADYAVQTSVGLLSGATVGCLIYALTDSLMCNRDS